MPIVCACFSVAFVSLMSAVASSSVSSLDVMTEPLSYKNCCGT